MTYETYTTYRDKAGLKDWQVAKKLKNSKPPVASATLYEWKKGTYQPKYDKQLVIAKLLKIPFKKVFE